MSKLDKLISELCPKGVEFKKVKDVYQRLKGTPITAGKMKEIHNPDGEIKIFAGGKTAINAHEENIPNANIIRTPAVLVQSRGIIDVIYYDKPFTFKNEMWAYTSPKVVSVKFLYHVLKNNIQHFRDSAAGMGSLPQISLPVTEEFLIPVPPLPVQREIVRILDNFTEVTAELTEKLMLELEARKKEYEYYRDMLLSFDNCSQIIKVEREREAHKWLTLSGASLSLNTGLNPQKFFTVKLGDYTKINRGIRVVRSQLSDSTGFPVYQNSIIPLGYNSQYNCPGDTAFVIAAGAAGEIGYSKSNFWAADDCFYFVCPNNLSSRYLYHILLFQKHTLLSQVRRASIPRLSRLTLEKLVIPLPPLEEQNRIVSILDHFDALCNDLTAGLPAEIEARKKQYEYYRDKLLTFQPR